MQVRPLLPAPTKGIPEALPRVCLLFMLITSVANLSRAQALGVFAVLTLSIVKLSAKTVRLPVTAVIYLIHPKPLAWGYLFSSENHGRKPLEGASPRGFRWAHFKYSQAIRENRSTPQSPATALPAPNTTTPRVYVIAAGGLHTRLRRDLLTQDHSSASINTLINEKPVVPAIQIISGRRRRSPFL